MSNGFLVRQYQQQAIMSSTPEMLVAKMYDLAISACHRDDRSKLRKVLAELISSLNFEKGGEIAGRLYNLYEYCMEQSVSGDLKPIVDILTGLRDAWNQGVLCRKAA
jgi:flagellar protein FliS